MDTRNKAMLFGILITIGMSMVAVAYVTGISEQLPKSNIVATIDGNNKTMSLIRNEKIVQTIKLPEDVEGVEYYYDEMSGEISIKYLTNEQLNVQRNTHIATLDKAVLITESDERVQQLIAGKNYTIPASGVMPGQKDAVVKLVIVIGNKSYEIVVDLGTEKVVAIQEMEELNNSLSISSIDNGDGTII